MESSNIAAAEPFAVFNATFKLLLADSAGKASRVALNAVSLQHMANAFEDSPESDPQNAQVGRISRRVAQQGLKNLSVRKLRSFKGKRDSVR